MTTPSRGGSGARTYRGLFLGSCVLALASVAVTWWLLPPGRIPVHFSGSGRPDGWGTRDELSAVLAGVVGVVALLLGGLAARSPHLSWDLVNMPDKHLWRLPENEARARARLQEDMYLMGSWTLWLLGAIPPLVLRAVRGAEESGGADPVDLALVPVACVVLVAAVLWRQRWYRRPPETQDA